ncbi:tetratricopeptide repeat protein [bacterium]|nr:tetratricopeptide repeat protein [bacterium]
MNKESETAFQKFNEGKYIDALSCYLRVFSSNLDNPKASYNVALCYDVMQEHELALSYYKYTLKLDSQNIRSLNNIAKIYLEITKDTNSAIYFLNQAIRINPKDAEAYNTFGKIYFELGDYQLSKLYLKKAIRLDKNYFQNYYDIAKVYIGLDDYKNAKKALIKCLELKPDFSFAKELYSKL